MKYIDVHAHLTMDLFDDDVDDVVARAKENDCMIVCSGSDSDANRKVLELSSKYDNVLCSFGVYPIDGIAKEFPHLSDDGPRDIVGFDVDQEIEWIREHRNDCVLIGEIGLDFKVVEATDEIKKAQIENFEKLIGFAKEIEKSILIHTRGAELECIELLEKHEAKDVIMHCFQGKKVFIRRIIENGWFLSVPAVITRLEHFKMLVEMTPIEQLLTETDSPFLAPVYATRNEPSNVMITVREIAKIKGLDEDVVREKLVENSKKLLKL